MKDELLPKMDGQQEEVHYESNTYTSEIDRDTSMVEQYTTENVSTKESKTESSLDSNDILETTSRDLQLSQTNSRVASSRVEDSRHTEESNNPVHNRKLKSKLILASNIILNKGIQLRNLLSIFYFLLDSETTLNQDLQNNDHNRRDVRVYYDHNNASMQVDRQFYIRNEQDQCFAILILIIFIYVVTSVSIILALVIRSFISD